MGSRHNDNEGKSRVAALRRYEILDTPPEEDFDDITRLAAHICGTPVSLVSLLDESRQWFKSKVGVDIDETPIEHAFCTHAVANSGLMEVPDAANDSRFSANPYVAGKPGFRFYAGAPLEAPGGEKIGTLCVLDHKPRKLTVAQREMLMLLAKQVVTQMELRLASRQLLENERRLRLFNNSTREGVAFHEDGRIIDVNAAWLRMSGYSRDELIGKPVTMLAAPESKDEAAQAIENAATVTYEAVALRKDGTRFPVEVTSGPMVLDGRSVRFACVRDITKRKNAENAVNQLNRDLERQVEERTSLMLESERFARASLDALTAHIAVLDGNGRIIATNKAWKDFAGRNQSRPDLVSEGIDYLAICDRAAAEGNPEAEAAVRCIRDVLSGRETSAVYDYSCHSPAEQRWFMCRVTRFPGDGPVRIVVAHENITRLKEAHRALLESEERFQLMVTSVRDYAIFMLDPDGNVAVWNKGAESFEGYGADEILGQNFRCFYTPEDAAAGVPEKLLGIARSDGRCATQGWRVRKDGSRFWADVSLTSIRDGADKLLGFSKVVRDITAQRETDALNRELAQALRSIREGVCITDLSHRIRFVNQSLLDMHGYSEDEVIGRDVAMLRAPDVPSSTAEGIAQTQKSGRWSGELLNMRKDGSVFPIHLTASVVNDDAGQPAAFVGVSTDLTERKRAASELRHKEEMLRTVLENLSEGVVTCDERGQLSFFNKTAREWHGADITRVPCERWPEVFDLYAADGRVLLDAPEVPLVRAYGGESVRNFEMSIVVKGRPPRIVLVNGDPIYDAEGKKLGAVVVMHDITDRKKSEAERLRNQRTESIGTLAGGIAHDLNNALAPVLMVAQLMRIKYPDAKQMLDTMEASAQRGANMVRQLLTFAKGVEGERRPLKSHDLLREIEKMVSSTFPKSIEVKTSFATDIDPIIGDATQLHQVLLNLCVNARDAMPKGGTLTLEAANVEFDETTARRESGARPGRFVMWRVADTGIGMTPDVLDRLFEPFFSTKGPEKGTGLGLSTLLGIVRSHRGFVSVKTTVGKGSTFSVHLPAADPEIAAIERTPTIGPFFSGSGETVLVVDDDTAVRATGRAVLESLNFQVLTAADGTSALFEVAQNSERLRLVITDLDMPRMDGLEFVRVLKHRLPKAGIIVASGRMTEKQALEFKKLGVGAILEKPYTQQKLVEALRRALN